MRCVAHCMHSVQCRSWWSAHSRHCGDGTRTAPLLSICISGSVNVTLCTTREPQTGSLQSPHMTVTSPHATSALHARVEAGARWRWNALPCASHALCGSRANQSPHARHEMSPPATPGTHFADGCRSRDMHYSTAAAPGGDCDTATVDQAGSSPIRSHPRYPDKHTRDPHIALNPNTAQHTKKTAPHPSACLWSHLTARLRGGREGAPPWVRMWVLAKQIKPSATLNLDPTRRQRSPRAQRHSRHHRAAGTATLLQSPHPSLLDTCCNASRIHRDVLLLAPSFEASIQSSERCEAQSNLSQTPPI